jgi:hypothetical protein
VSSAWQAFPIVACTAFENDVRAWMLRQVRISNGLSAVVSVVVMHRYMKRAAFFSSLFPLLPSSIWESIVKAALTRSRGLCTDIPCFLYQASASTL